MPLQTLGADWRAIKGSVKRAATPSPLNSIKWHRVVLDVSGLANKSDNALYIMRKGMEA